MFETTILLRTNWLLHCTPFFVLFDVFFLFLSGSLAFWTDNTSHSILFGFFLAFSPDDANWLVLSVLVCCYYFFLSFSL